MSEEYYGKGWDDGYRVGFNAALDAVIELLEDIEVLRKEVSP